MRIIFALSLAVVTSAGLIAGQHYPRTRAGKPDLQGTWTNATLTPLVRPQNQPNLVMSAEQAARMEKSSTDRRDTLYQPSDPNRPGAPHGRAGLPARPRREGGAQQ
jgi:hypothetical protein